MQQDERTTLVVIEFGASWPKWLDPGQAGHLAVVAQHYEGEPSSLVRQVANRVARLETTGWHIGTTILVVNSRTDADAFAARSVLARGMLSRHMRAHDGELVLTLGEGAELRACQTLTGLAAALDLDAVGSGVRVSVRLGSQAALYGDSTCGAESSGRGAA
ncbi:MAG: hypothetical protein KF718_05475 [Polyangiaceae bacterium]|nr:hypothetical protein [Polyangiaceae bacterium]